MAKHKHKQGALEDQVSPGAARLEAGAGPPPKMKRKEYEREMKLLHAELVAMQEWVKASGARICIVFEGRDTAGKGGTIKRITERVSPRVFRVVALTAPTEREKSQMYIQRYLPHFPAAGEVVILDRSWYNRAGVEPVMGFCTPEQTDQFLHEAPQFEAMLVRDGIRLFKLFLTIGQAMQLKRLHARQADPLKQWKLSPIDHQAVGKWEAYSNAYDRMLAATDTVDTPWTIVKANDKYRTRLAAIRAVLAELPYPDKDEKLVGDQDHKIVLTAERFLAKGGEV
jgi:polyphosphate kinase